MGDLLLPYLVAMAATLVAIILAAGAFVASHVRSVSCQKREARLPLATRWSDLSHKVADLEAERTELQEALHEARQLIDEGERMREYIERTRLEVEQLEEQHRQLQEVETRLTQVQEQLAAETQKLDGIASELRAAEFGRDEANRKREELEKRIEELKSSIDAMNAAHGEIQQRLDDRRAELAEVKGELESVRARIEPAKAELERIGAELTERRKRLNELEARRDTLEQEIESIREQRGAAAAEVEALQARGSGLEARAQQLENQVGGLRSELLASNPRLRPFEDQIVDLTQGVLSSGAFDAPVSDDCPEEQQLSNVRQVLADRGYRFSRRVIDAFHTSLKVSSETPLLVLAGISGTGKSLLPRLYAEVMGMHFLMMPVQPRWDGPQDLLGFYNHLENRFQPTELTRALIQMDRFAQGHLGQAEIDTLHDRMLLILLDEMNLARVEYYFSDFLSRLEARRDIGDVEDAQRRQIAEIVVETGGASSDDYDDVRLFVDSNVLFAGTMNEDESTLALSDKVIDRANVMRFGRPRQLHAPRSNGTMNAAHSLSNAFLPRSVWDRWVRESDANALPDEAEGWITRMNDALSSIGRPFGYRTANAIRAYIRRYPSRSNNGYRCAMCDQIEQRVLPKLRGAEPDDPATGDCIRQVHSLAQELGDAPLTAAIDRARQGHGGHLFVWSGTERSDEE